MIQMEAVSTGGSHDGGIGDGGAMVAHNAAGAGSGQADGAQHGLHVVVEHGNNDGGHNADGTPGGTGGEADGSADQEDHGRQEHLQVACTGHGVLDELGGVHGVTGEGAQGPREGQDQDGGDHLDKALRHRLEGLLEADSAAQPEVDKGEHAADQTAQRQSRTGIGVGEGHHEVMVAVSGIVIVAAGPDQGDHADDDQDDDGHQQVGHGGLTGSGLLIIVSTGEGTLGSGEQVVLDLGVVLMGQHGAVVDVQQGDDHDHDQSQQAVVVPGDLLDEHLDTVDGVRVDVAGNGGGPGGHGSDHADGSGGSVDDVSQLGAGDLVGLGDGTHDSADSQAVEIVVDEDQDAQQHGHQLRTSAAGDGLLGPAAEGLRAAALVHQVNHDAQNHQEHDDTHVIAVGQNGDDTVVGTHQRHSGVPGSEAGVQQRAHQAAQEQGGIHFLRDQGQHDGNDGGQQGPEGTGKRGSRLNQLTIDLEGGQRSALERDAENDQQHDKDTQRYEIRNLGAFLFHYEIYLLMIYGALILTCFWLIVNISAIARAGNFEQIMNRTFSLFSNFGSFLHRFITYSVFFSSVL